MDGDYGDPAGWTGAEAIERLGRVPFWDGEVGRREVHEWLRDDGSDFSFIPRFDPACLLPVAWFDAVRVSPRRTTTLGVALRSADDARTVAARAWLRLDPATRRLVALELMARRLGGV